MIRKVRSHRPASGVNSSHDVSLRQILILTAAWSRPRPTDRLCERPAYNFYRFIRSCPKLQAKYCGEIIYIYMYICM